MVDGLEDGALLAEEEDDYAPDDFEGGDDVSTKDAIPTSTKQARRGTWKTKVCSSLATIHFLYF